jgi:hypothetical protein
MGWGYGVGHWVGTLGGVMGWRLWVGVMGGDGVRKLKKKLKMNKKLQYLYLHILFTFAHARYMCQIHILHHLI